MKPLNFKYLILFLAFGSGLKSQQKAWAEISFLSGESVYLRFANTRGLGEGDTLFNAEGQACLSIQKVSSVSVLARSISDCTLQKGQRFWVRLRADAEEGKAEEASPPSPVLAESKADSIANPTQEATAKREPRKRGFIDLAWNSGSTFSDGGRANYRNVLRMNMRADSLLGRDLSLEFYSNAQSFVRNFNSDGDDFRANVYNLALVYQPRVNQRLVLGRKINPRIASLGAIDGLQWEGKWKAWRSGVIAGSRPDFENYGLNLNLMQYGAYGAYDWRGKQSMAQLSIGLMEQRNQGATDRRYLYTQQSFRLGKGYYFASAEVDLYQNFDTAQASSAFQLSSLYLSARYRVNKRLSLFASFDSRRPVIFFERYDNEVERLLSEQGAREGWRLRADYQIFKRSLLGLSYNLRTNPTFGNAAQNLQLYWRQNRLPWVGGSLSYRFNLNRNGNLNSEINSLRYYRSFRSGFNFSAYYRYASYGYVLRDIILDPQHYYGVETAWQMGDDWRAGLMAEYSMINQENVLRVYFRISKRLQF